MITDVNQLKSLFASQWTTRNPRLKQSEFGYELDTGALKLGDGVRYWVDLPYYSPGQAYTDAAILVESAARTAADSALSSDITAAEIRARRSTIYVPFTPTGIDDEFDDASFTGWTAVTPGTQDPTTSEANDNLSIYNPGSQATAGLRAWVKSTTISAGDIIEMVFRGFGRSQNFNICGLIFADGTTYTAGNQQTFALSTADNALVRHDMTGYNTFVSGTSYGTAGVQAFGDVFLRLKYSAANTFIGYTSADGNLWFDVTGNLSNTLTPTHCGFFVSSWGGTLPFTWSIRYFRKTT